MKTCTCCWQFAGLFTLLSFACTGVVTTAPDQDDSNDEGQSSQSPSMTDMPDDGNDAVHGDVSLDNGRVVLRRLNRIEFNNTLRDLLGASVSLGEDFPADGVAHGFDTAGHAISIAPVHLEFFEQTAFAAVDELLARANDDPIRRDVIPCAGVSTACTRSVVERLMPRAYRRPVIPKEIDDVVELAERVSGETQRAGDGLRAALATIVLSPHFLFRVETFDDADASVVQELTPHELATRLSYALWSTMPDDELRLAADEGELVQPDVLGEQIARMLNDERAIALSEHFAGQWLHVRDLDLVSPSRNVYPAFDEALRDSMLQETTTFFANLLSSNARLSELLTADYTFANARLAEHYGLPFADHSSFTEVSLAQTPRRGLVTQGSILLATSQPERTSPVKRGAWILEQLLCTAPPPPPPNVEGLSTPEPGDGTTLRQALERHRADPACASCHRLMDPLGLGLENFDGIGAYREMDNGQPIDASGELLEGQMFDSPTELMQLLAADERFAHCVAEKMLTYAVGRGFETRDARAYAAALAEQSGGREVGLQQLFTQIVTSEAFVTKRSALPADGRN